MRAVTPFLIGTMITAMMVGDVAAQTETPERAPPASAEGNGSDQAPSAADPPNVAQQPAASGEAPKSEPTPQTNEASRPGDEQPAPPQPAAPNSPPNTASAPAAPPPATASVLATSLILGVLGKEVRSSTNENMGRVVDVIVDRSGQTRAAIIDFGGFLGVGSRRIAVDWSALHFAPEDKGNQITLDLTRDQVKAAPEYKEGKQVVVLGASGSTETIQSN